METPPADLLDLSAGFDASTASQPAAGLAAVTVQDPFNLGAAFASGGLGMSQSVCPPAVVQRSPSAGMKPALPFTGFGLDPFSQTLPMQPQGAPMLTAQANYACIDAFSGLPTYTPVQAPLPKQPAQHSARAEDPFAGLTW